MKSMQKKLRDLLVRSLCGGPIQIWEYDELYINLVRFGIMDDPEQKFSSLAAAAFLNYELFPSRSGESIGIIAERGIFALIKAVLARMSASDVRCAITGTDTSIA